MNKDTPLSEVLQGGEPARLIPVGKETQRENRATSVLLAGMSAIRPLAKTLLEGVGQKLGSRATLTCYSQVVFKNDYEEWKHRPDGLIEITLGNRTWRAIVESKIGRERLDAEQIHAYAQLGKANNINAIITVSNQFASLPTHHPVKLVRPLPRSIALYHWSWAHVLTTAILELGTDELESVAQRYLLSEFIRYFEHPSSGIERFTQMNPEWKDVVTQVQQGANLGRETEPVLNTVASWHQETRDLCLHLTQSLQQTVRVHLPAKHVADPALRLKDEVRQLKETAQLRASLDVADAAADIDVSVDIRGRTMTISMDINAPKDKKTTKGRVNWLLRQLRATQPDDIVIFAYWPLRQQTSSEPFQALRENPDSLASPVVNIAPRKFSVRLVRHIGAKFSGRRTFIEALEECVPHFYREVGQRLRVWVPTPPQSPPAPQESRSETVATDSHMAQID